MTQVTKLKLVQEILSRMVEEGVSSTGESEVAEMVEAIVTAAYQEILTTKDWAYLISEGQLNTNPDNILTMTLPDNLLTLHVVKYNDTVVNEISDWVSFNKIKSDTFGTPLYYHVIGNVIHFDRIPEEGLIKSNSEILFTRLPNDIPNDSSVLDAPDRFITAIKQYALMLAYSSIQNKDSQVSLYAQLYKRSMIFLQKWQYTGSSQPSTMSKIDYSRR